MEDNYLRNKLGEEKYTEVIESTQLLYGKDSVEELTIRIGNITDAIGNVNKAKGKALQSITEYAIEFASGNTVGEGLNIDVWTNNVRNIHKLEEQKSKLMLERKVLRKIRQDNSDCTCGIHCPTLKDEVTL